MKDLLPDSNAQRVLCWATLIKGTFVSQKLYIKLHRYGSTNHLYTGCLNNLN